MQTSARDLYGDYWPKLRADEFDMSLLVVLAVSINILCDF